MVRIERQPAHVVLEQVCWTLAVASLAGMILVMPWVGQDKLIPGTTWLGTSLLFMGLFASLAYGVRVAFSDVGREADEQLRSGLEHGGNR